MRLRPSGSESLRDEERQANASLRRAGVERLEHWDQQMDAERPEALIFSAWMRELARGVYADELGHDFWRIGNGQSRWCDDVTTPAPEPCAVQIQGSLCRGLALLVERYGGDLDGWRWGAAHVARSRHVPLTAVRC